MGVVDWTEEILSNLADVVAGGTPPTSNKENWNGETLWATPSDITSTASKYIFETSRKITKKGTKYSSELLPIGSILLCTRATIGESKIAAKPITTNQGFKSLVVKSGVSNEWLFYVLQTKIEEMKSLSSGSTFLELGTKQLKEIKIDTPKFTEQKAIAEALSDIDKNISSLISQISKCELFQIGLRTKLLTGVQRLSNFGGKWEMKCLGQLTDPVMGQSPLSSSYNKFGKGIPLIQGQADVEKGFSLERTWTTNPTRTVPCGTVLMSVRAPVGAISIASTDVCLGRGMAGFIPKRIDPSFLRHLLKFIEPQWSIFEQGSTFTAINKSTVVNFEVFVPSVIEEQSSIAHVLDSVEEYLLTLTKSLEKFERLKQAMMNDLLTGKVRLV